MHGEELYFLTNLTEKSTRSIPESRQISLIKRPRRRMSSYHKSKISQGVSGGCMCLFLCVCVCAWLYVVACVCAKVPPLQRHYSIFLYTFWNRAQTHRGECAELTVAPKSFLDGVQRYPGKGLQVMNTSHVWDMKHALRKREMAKQEGWVSPGKSQPLGGGFSKVQHMEQYTGHFAKSRCGICL